MTGIGIQEIINRGRASFVAEGAMQYDKIIAPYVAIIVKLSKEAEELKRTKASGKKK